MAGMTGMPEKELQGENSEKKASTPNVTVLEKPLHVTLEDLFTGITKKMKVKRKTYDASTGTCGIEERLLVAPIRKGLKAGSKIKFFKGGDEDENTQQDLHFIVVEVCGP
jgi:DnaJ family protein B protein 4